MLCYALLSKKPPFALLGSLRWFWWKFIYKKECVDDYLQGLDYLRRSGYNLVAMVGDGLRGLSKAVSPLPFQFCQFHAQNYAKIKLTNNPKTEAGINLLKIANSIFYKNSTEFRELLENFYNEFGDFLSEKTREPLGVADVSVKNHKRKRQIFLHAQKA